MRMILIMMFTIFFQDLFARLYFNNSRFFSVLLLDIIYLLVLSCLTINTTFLFIFFSLQNQLAKLMKEKEESDQRVAKLEEEVTVLKLSAT